jgi:N-acetylneuraminic acid mutarotase
LTNAGATTSRTEVFDPIRGVVTPGAPLRIPVHDAAAGVIGTTALVVGGGASSSSDAIQSLNLATQSSVVGHLPQVRSDDSAAVLGTTLYVLGGYDGARELPGVLATNNGADFHQIGALPVTVRYGAACATPGALWMFGGEHNGTATSDVQRIDLSTGTGSLAGPLPHPLAHAACALLDGHLLLIGGTDGKTAQSTVYEISDTTGLVTAVGSLPERVTDMGVAVVGDVAFVVGGNVTSAAHTTAPSSAIVAITLTTP